MKKFLRQYIPPEVLRPYVECYHELDQTGISDNDLPMQRCLPNGMAELNFTLSERPAVGIIHGKWNVFPRAYLVGIMREPVLWRMGSKGILFSARLKPEGIYTLFGLRPYECFNGFLDLESILNPASRDIINRMQETSGSQERIRLMDTFLINQLAVHRKKDLYLEEALRQLRQAPVSLSIDSVSRHLAICKRQFERRFKQTFGLSPKTYQRIMRFNKTYEYLEKNPVTRWTELSYTFGYADQAHFIREFKHFYGETPALAMKNM